MIGLSAGTTEENIIQANAVETIILAGESAEFDNCTIVGDLNLSGLIIEKPVHFNHTIFQDTVMFNSTAFKGDAYFWNSAFNGTAYFWNSAFNSDACFRNSAFNSDAYFWNSAFNGTACFWNSVFNSNAYFWNSAFNDYAYFGNSAFNGYAYFANSAFNGYADFGNSAFNGYAYFGNLAFNGYAYFGNLTFNGNADFGNSVFNDYAYFGHSAFKGDAYFGNSAFNGYAVFENSAFNGDADFVEVQFCKETDFDDSQFNGTTSFNCSRFKEDAFFEGSDFNCTIYLIRTKYEKMFIRWSSIKDIAYDDAAYLSLMENFKKLGYFEDYNDCYYEYRNEHRDHDRGGKYHGMNPVEEWARKQIDVVLEIFYGYGKKPLYPLGWAIGTVLLFGIIWMIGGLKADDNETDDNKSRQYLRKSIIEKSDSNKEIVSKNQSTGCDWRNEIRILAGAMIFSATIFLSGTRLFIDPPDLPTMPRWTRFQTKAAFTTERILGAFFSVLFFLSIGATIVR